MDYQLTEEYFEVIFPLLSRLRDAGHKFSVFVADKGSEQIDRGGWEFNASNAEFSLEGWKEKLEEASVISTLFFVMLTVNSMYVPSRRV